VKVADKRESLIEPIPASEFFTDRIFTERMPDPVPASPVAESVEAEIPMPSTFAEDLDVPAYLRQGKLLNSEAADPPNQEANTVERW
jgi:hypothetical protein